MVEIVLVAAVAKNGIIGSDNDMPWKLSSDLKHFKAMTVGRPVIMGRKTFESLGRPLPGRPNLVLTRDEHFSAEGVEIYPSLESALVRCEVLLIDLKVDEIMVVGGGEIYRKAMELADRLEITEVDAEPEGDTSFPSIDMNVWQRVSIRQGERTEKDSENFAFVTYRRRKDDENVIANRFESSWLTYDELTKDQLYEVLRLRQDIFVVEQQSPYGDIDGNDRDTLHFLITERKTNCLAAAIRLFSAEGEGSAARIGRVVVHRDFRRFGLGRFLMAEGIAKARELAPGCEIVISAQTYLERFYGEFGFVKNSEEYIEDGIPHIDMKLPSETMSAA